MRNYLYIFVIIISLNRCNYIPIGSQENSPEEQWAVDCHFMELMVTAKNCSNCDAKDRAFFEMGFNYMLLLYMDRCIINKDDAIKSYGCRNC
jgi:hypothetical protein